MPLILDGKKARSVLKEALIKKIQGLSSGTQPCLGIVQVGTRADSTAYIGAKKKFAAEIGVAVTCVQLPETATQQEVLASIAKLNGDNSVRGIIVQLPLPAGMNREIILNAITPPKDVDGLSEVNVRKWMNNNSDALWPATARGVRELFDFYSISLKGKKVTVIGRSALVGKPTAAMCIAAGAEVTVCHRGTLDLVRETTAADIIIAAAGAPRLIGAAHVRPGQVIIDIGLSSIADGESRQLTGDVDYDAVVPVIGDTGAITPVPGGVGQMTVLALFENLLDA